MSYHKPDIELLGEAICIIEGIKENIGAEGPYVGTIVVPAYELDQ